MVHTSTHYRKAVTIRPKRFEDIFTAFFAFVKDGIRYKLANQIYCDTIRKPPSLPPISSKPQGPRNRIALSSTESHNSIGDGERYHAPLRKSTESPVLGTHHYTRASPYDTR